MAEFNCLFKSEKGLDLCKKIPTVEYKKEWHEGGTSYLDGVRPTDSVFSETSVVKFVDNAGRSAISFKYQVDCQNTEESNKEYAVTAFQRYSEFSTPWVFGGHFSAPDSITEAAIFNHTWLENLLITGSEATEMRHIDESGNYLYIPCTLTLSGNTAESSVLIDAA